MQFDLLEALSTEEERAVLARMSRRRFRKGDTLFHEGDPGDSLHLVDKGHVAIRVGTPNGDMVTVVVLGPGTSFGEQALLSADARRTASAVAVDAVETRTLQRHDVADLRASHPSIDRFLIDLLAGQVRRLTGQVLEALYTPADQRVIRRLADLTDMFDTGTMPVVISMRQEDLATMAGTTRPTANRVLQQLVESGAIELHRGRIDVLDAEAVRIRAR